MRTLGPKYGKFLNEIRTLLAEIDGNAAMSSLKNEGVLKLALSDGSEAELTMEDVLVETKQVEGFVSLSEGEITVALDTELTPELLEEGMIREIISKIQTMRKEAGFEVMDHIRVYVSGNEVIEKLFEEKSADILSEVLADSYSASEGGYSKSWDINGEEVVLGVEKI